MYRHNGETFYTGFRMYWMYSLYWIYSLHVHVYPILTELMI